MNPGAAKKISLRRTPYDIEAIADCAKLITQIITDNQETINLIFQDINKKLKEDDNTFKEIIAYKEGK